MDTLITLTAVLGAVMLLLLAATSLRGTRRPAPQDESITDERRFLQLRWALLAKILICAFVVALALRLFAVDALTDYVSTPTGRSGDLGPFLDSFERSSTKGSIEVGLNMAVAASGALLLASMLRLWWLRR